MHGQTCVLDVSVWGKWRKWRDQRNVDITRDQRDNHVESRDDFLSLRFGQEQPTEQIQNANGFSEGATESWMCTGQGPRTPVKGPRKLLKTDQVWSAQAQIPRDVNGGRGEARRGGRLGLSLCVVHCSTGPDGLGS